MGVVGRTSRGSESSVESQSGGLRYLLLAHVHPGQHCLEGYRPVASRLHSACRARVNMCSGVYKAHEAPTVRTEAPTVRSTGAPDHQPNTRSEGGDHPGTNTIINGGGHPYARHPPGYPRGRPGGVSKFSAHFASKRRGHTLCSLLSGLISIGKGQAIVCYRKVPARVWLSQPLECIP